MGKAKPIASLAAQQMEPPGDFYSRHCQHNVTDEIVSEGGETIGEQCASCMTVLAGYGTCARPACAKKGRLTFRMGEDENTRQYCTKDCRTAELKDQRTAAEAAKKAAPAK